MNRYLGGCLIALAILVVGGGAAGYFLFIKPAGEFVSRMVEYGKEFEALNEEIEVQGDYTPDEGAELTERQLNRYLAAQRMMKEQLSTRLQALDAKFKELEARLKPGQRDMDLTDIASAYLEIGDLIMEAKRAQVSALNRQEFSIQEYAWVRARVYQAIGQSVNVAAIGAERQAKTGVITLPEETVKMVEPYRKELLETHVLAWFGL